MVALPSFCGTCGLIFPALRFGGNFRDTELDGHSLPCPRCGAMAEISGGTFDLVEETVESLSAAELNPDRLERLLKALKRFRLEVAAPSTEPRQPVNYEALLLVPALEGLPLTMQKVVAFFLETVVQLLLSGQTLEGPHLTPTAEDVREAAQHALQHQRMFPR